MQVIFAVADAERAAAFYETAFGWPRNSAIDYRNYVELLVDGGALGLYERAGYGDEVGAEPVAIRDGAVAPSYLYVRVEDVDGVAARLAAAGARPLSALSERAWGERAAWFADPDGNVVAVAGAAPSIAE
jgi:uncharacterized glyoxalase superfamily protein PhnB